MKRWVVILLVVLAVVVLISPGIVGRMAEKSIEENVTWADDENPAVKVTKERFDRGWFTSEGTHRIVFDEGTLRSATDSLAGNTPLPALIINTRIDHGLVPVTSLARDEGSLLPGLANTVSTFKLDTGSGEPIDFPGTLYSSVGLTGASESRFLLETGSYDSGDIRADWQGADLVIASNPATGAVAVKGGSGPFSIAIAGETFEIGTANIDSDQVRSDYGFNVGDVDATIDAFSVAADGTEFSAGKMMFSAESNVRDARVNAETDLSFARITIPGFGEIDLEMQIDVERLDAASLGVINAAIKQAQSAQDPALEFQMMYPQIEGEVQDLVAAGGKIRFDQLDVTLPQGKLESSLEIELGEIDGGADFSWPAALLAMTANLDLRIPGTLYDFAAMMSAEAGTLVAMGVLIRDGDDYVMDAEYAQGLLNVNGAPMPVPMPGM